MSTSQDRFPNQNRNEPDRYQYIKLGGGFSTDLPQKHPGDFLHEQLKKIYSQAAKSESSHASTDDNDEDDDDASIQVHPSVYWTLSRCIRQSSHKL